MGGGPSYHSSGLTMAQASEFKDSFDVFDTDGSGQIDGEELQRLMRAFGQDLSMGQIETLIAEFDADGTGEIDFNQFVTLIVARMERAMMEDDEQVKRAFDVFDNGTGEISIPSLRTALGKRIGKAITQEEAEAMVASADIDGNGTVSLQEFINFSKGRAF
eukprot:TRINITY_DN592_c0_g1_i2.p1 TRINITY_DN592_c0_g1~~TRINITY_DN592_c0_g1_i2.p1  ORF type:complete len:161 (-),score=34.76 TRINITY_DN592_c0_g1_i2:351-833(-)